MYGREREKEGGGGGGELSEEREQKPEQYGWDRDLFEKEYKK